MSEITKETVTTNANNDRQFTKTVPEIDATKTQKAEYLIYFFFGFLEILLVFRLLFKLTGASQSSGFVRVIYAIAGIFTLPFQGIFRSGFSPGLETTAVLEPSTIVAILVYVLLAWGIVKLVKISSGKKQEN
jgi:hypothetical protein